MFDNDEKEYIESNEDTTENSTEEMNDESTKDIEDNLNEKKLSEETVEEDEVLEGFIEFKPFIGYCKFRDCSHRHEPGCAILKALEDGTISATRMDSYRYILRTLNEN